MARLLEGLKQPRPEFLNDSNACHQAILEIAKDLILVLANYALNLVQDTESIIQK